MSAPNRPLDISHRDHGWNRELCRCGSIRGLDPRLLRNFPGCSHLVTTRIPLDRVDSWGYASLSDPREGSSPPAKRDARQSRQEGRRECRQQNDHSSRRKKRTSRPSDADSSRAHLGSLTWRPCPTRTTNPRGRELKVTQFAGSVRHPDTAVHRRLRFGSRPGRREGGTDSRHSGTVLGSK